MRGVVLAVTMVSAVALADILPQKEDCGAPAVCRACSFARNPDGGNNIEEPAGCSVGAQDAGLETFPCVQSDGGTNTYFYCPPDTDSAPTQGCSSVLIGVPLTLLAVFGAWRTRKRA